MRKHVIAACLAVAAAGMQAQEPATAPAAPQASAQRPAPVVITPESLTKELGLTPEQHEQLERVFSEHAAGAKAINRENLEPAVKRERTVALREKKEKGILAILTEEQRTRYNALKQGMHDARKEQRKAVQKPHQE
jgi:hypothetical protein